jgi:predicted nucleic acid-binding protein
MIGLDTGFFVELVRNNLMAVRIWEGIVEGDESAVSCLTLYELQPHLIFEKAIQRYLPA